MLYSESEEELSLETDFSSPASSSLVIMSSSSTIAVSQKVALFFRSSLELEKMLTNFSARSFLKRFL